MGIQHAENLLQIILLCMTQIENIQSFIRTVNNVICNTVYNINYIYKRYIFINCKDNFCQVTSMEMDYSHFNPFPYFVFKWQYKWFIPADTISGDLVTESVRNISSSRLTF